jgi:hypothetical protein
MRFRTVQLRNIDIPPMPFDQTNPGRNFVKVVITPAARPAKPLKRTMCITDIASPIPVSCNPALYAGFFLGGFALSQLQQRMGFIPSSQ